MKRRSFFKLASALGAGLASPAALAQVSRIADEDEDFEIDPYFLDSGDVSNSEQQEILSHIAFEDQDAGGRPVMQPRGRRPDKAPTYRFLHWQGPIGDPAGQFVGPLSLQPKITAPPPYRFNAQILGFNQADSEWGKKGDGTLSVEFRARHQGDSMTWLHLQTFNVEDGYNNLGLEYVAHRDGAAEDVVAEDANVDMRIQLIRHAKPPGALRAILGVASSIIGVPAGPPSGPGPGGMAPRGPAMLRVPRMAQEAVAFAQATLGGTAKEKPIWRSGFTTFGLAEGGSRLTLNPGLWVAMDKIEGISAGDLALTEGEGSVILLHKGEPAEFTYLVLDVRVRSAA
jgi:hypothetical protein